VPHINITFLPLQNKYTNQSMNCSNDKKGYACFFMDVEGNPDNSQATQQLKQKKQKINNT